MALVADQALPVVRSVRVVVDGRVDSIPRREVAWYGPSLTIAVGDRRVEAVEVTFAVGGRAEGGAERRLDLREVWTHPAG